MAVEVSFILARLRERNTAADLVAGIAAAAFLPLPWGPAALVAVILSGLIPAAPSARARP